MKALDPVRRFLKLCAWAASLGLVASGAHALLVLQLASLLEKLGRLASADEGHASLALAGSAILLALLAFAVVWLACLLLELPRAWGAAAGAFSALLPLGVLAAVEGFSALGPPRLAAARAGSVALAALAGALAVRKRRQRATQDEA